MKPLYFATPAEFESWLAKHHARASELWVGFHKRATGRPSLTWPQSVDAALSFGWIDGLRRSLGAHRYAIRFSPRRPRSIWSTVNIRRVQALRRAGRMRPAGLAAFARRLPNRSGVYSFEQRPRKLPPRYETPFKARPAAWTFFRSQPPWYRRAAIWWVVSAKLEATRARRLATLIDDSGRGRTLAPLTRPSRAPAARSKRTPA